jgi:hypothetical protein
MGNIITSHIDSIPINPGYCCYVRYAVILVSFVDIW